MKTPKLLAVLGLLCAGGLYAFSPAGNPAANTHTAARLEQAPQTGATVINKMLTRDINSKLIDYVDNTHILDVVYWVPENAAGQASDRAAFVQTIVSKY